MNQQAKNLADTLDRKTAQLEAALSVASTHAFTSLDQATKGDFLWLCSDLASEIRSDFDSFRNTVNESAKTEGGDQ